MERKIGETFEFEGHKLKVVDRGDSKCDECFFYKRDCSSIRDVRGFCSEEYRTDKENVIFEEVTEEAEKQQEEQPQKLNLCEVLKHCPKGEQFWSPMLGYVALYDIDNEKKRVYIILKTDTDIKMYINADATLTLGDVTSPEIMLYPSKEQRDWSKVKYEPKKELPRTWEEFCQQNLILKLEYFIDDSSDVRKAKNDGGIRHKAYDRNTLPSKQAAEAHLALMQLHQLRDTWREGWLPDWKDEFTYKYVIVIAKDEYVVQRYTFTSCFLSFQDEKRAGDFLECFRDLIMKAGDLI